MTTTIETLLSFDGPNIIGPQPAVLLRVRCPQDYSRRLRFILKEAAQRVGLVIGFLDVDGRQDGNDWLITARFATPLPAFGREVALFAIEELNAQARDDEEWDRETPLYNMGRQRRKEAAPVPLLQLEAEAIQRGLPLSKRPDGLWQVGTGAQSWAFESAAIVPGQALVPPWEQIGSIPIIAFAGGVAPRIALDLIYQTFGYAAPHIRIAYDLDHAAAATLLADPNLDQLFAGVSVTTIATAGLPFDGCFISAVLDLEGVRPAGLTDEEWVQALGVPMLVTDSDAGFALLNADDPRIVGLMQYATCRVILMSSRADNEAVQAHCVAGGAALFVRDGMVILVAGDEEQQLGPVPPLEGPALIGTLAAGFYLMGLRGYGIDVTLPWEF